MHRVSKHDNGWAVSRAAWYLMASAVAVFFSGCASSGGLTGSSGNISAPSNYRQAIAAKLKQWEKVSDIRSAEITKPHNKFLGLIVGGTRPAVCVKLVMPNLIGSNAAYYYDFYFDNGEVDGYRQGATSQYQIPFIGCGNEPLTKFTELVG
jgi:hypothetical protein